MSEAIPVGIETRPVPGAELKYAAGSDGHVYCYSAARCNARKQGKKGRFWSCQYKDCLGPHYLHVEAGPCKDGCGATHWKDWLTSERRPEPATRRVERP